VHDRCHHVSPELGNESMPKITINYTVNLFFNTAIRILVISNRNSFRVLFDRIATVYFTRKIYLYFSIRNGQPREPALCQLYRHTFAPSWKSGLESRIYQCLDCSADHGPANLGSPHSQKKFAGPPLKGNAEQRNVKGRRDRAPTFASNMLPTF